MIAIGYLLLRLNLCFEVKMLILDAPTDFLPHQLPNARILLFGYNSNVAFETSSDGVCEQAFNLLNRIASKRENDEARVSAH